MAGGGSDDDLTGMRRQVAEGTPHGKAIGLHLDEVLPEAVRLSLAPQPAFVADAASGVLHGGIITTLLDHACGMAVHFNHGRGSQAIATLDLRIDYMRGTTGKAGLKAYAHCYKVTRNVAFARGIAYENDESDLIAHCAATFMLAASRANLDGKRAEVSEQPAPRDGGAVAAAAGQTSPYLGFLGVQPSDDPAVTAILPFQRHLIGNPVLPALHGGVIGGFLEAAAILEMQRVLGPDGRAKPVNITVNYVRSGRARETYALARITRRGRRVLGFAVEAWQDDRDKPIATAFGHFLARPQAGDPGGGAPVP